MVGLGKLEMGRQGGIPSDWLLLLSLVGPVLETGQEKEASGHQLSFDSPELVTREILSQNSVARCSLAIVCLHTQYITAYSMYQCVCVCVCLVTQLCPTLCDPMDCGPPGSSVHGSSSGKNTGVSCHALLQGIFPI